LSRAIDANQHPTVSRLLAARRARFTDYHATGFPELIVDPLGGEVETSYDPRGNVNVTVATDPPTAATYTLRLLAARIAHLTTEVDDLNARITEVIGAHTPTLLERYGVGPDTASCCCRRRQPRPAGQRGLLRCALRREPHRSVVRPDPAPSPQSRWRPAR
jgi:hypothetical protein